MVQQTQIQLHGGASDYLLKSLQVLQNRAARTVTKHEWGTSTAVMLNQIGWLSIKQLVVHHSLILAFKVKRNKKPCYVNMKLNQNFAYSTRQATGNCILLGSTPKSEKSKSAFVFNSSNLWNDLPLSLRMIEKLPKFKTELKKWVMKSVQI